MIEVVFQVRKDKFKDYPAIVKELDLITEEDQCIHMISLEDNFSSEDMLSKKIKLLILIILKIETLSLHVEIFVLHCRYFPT